MDDAPEISKLSVNNLGDSQLGSEMFMLMLTFQTSPKFVCCLVHRVPADTIYKMKKKKKKQLFVLNALRL